MLFLDFSCLLGLVDTFDGNFCISEDLRVQCLDRCLEGYNRIDCIGITGEWAILVKSALACSPWILGEVAWKDDACPGMLSPYSRELGSLWTLLEVEGITGLLLWHLSGCWKVDDPSTTWEDEGPVAGGFANLSSITLETRSVDSGGSSHSSLQISVKICHSSSSFVFWLPSIEQCTEGKTWHGTAGKTDTALLQL